MSQNVNPVAVGSTGWWRQQLVRQQSMNTRFLTMEAINSAASTILDTEGVESLTMRHLAASLDSRAPSLYRHVKGREELLVHVTDHVLGEVERPQLAADWQSAIEAVAVSLRTVMLKHPWMTQVGTRSPLLGPNAMRLRELFWEPMDRAGHQPETTIRTYYAVLHFTICSVLFAVNALPPQYREQKRSPSTRLDELLDVLPADKYPTVLKLGAHPMHPDVERDFLLGLRALITSFAQ